MGSKYTKRYTAEFKRDAIALVDSTGKTVTAVARELGISPESLRGWSRQAGHSPEPRRCRTTEARPAPVAGCDSLGSQYVIGRWCVPCLRFRSVELSSGVR
ncbi:transposase [Streptomyces sp. Isolate_219]|uniref:transposase n=1 Tax=Streptomyces sp. Isolate_219 TaxID=2950110 RepID=UPI003966F89A